MAECSVCTFSDPCCAGTWLKTQYEKSGQNLATPIDATSDLRGDTLFKFHKSKMLMQGNFELNFVQRYAYSLKEVLKQTMLSQEIIFRKQVYELHRLYSIQKTLMEDLGWMEFDGFNCWKASTQTSMAFANSPKNEVSPQSKNKDLLEVYESNCSNVPRWHLDLQLPADQYIGHVGTDLPNEDNACNCLKKSSKFKHSLVGELVSDPEELKLSLSVGKDTSNKGCSHRSSYNKKNCSCQDVFDLEESIERVTNENVRPSSSLSLAAPTNYCRGEIELQVSVPSNAIVSKSGKKDPAHGIGISCSTVDGWESYQEQIFNDGGFDVLRESLFTKKQQLVSCEAWQMDLNRVQLDDSSCLSKDPLLSHPSNGSLSSDFHEPLGKFHEGSCHMATWRKLKDGCPNKTSDMLQHGDVLNSGLKDNSTDDSCKEIWARNAKHEGTRQSEVVLINHQSILGPPWDLCEDLGSHGSNSKDLPLECPNGLLHEGNHKNVATTYISCEKSEEQDISASSPFKSDGLTDNHSSGLQTLQSGTEMGDSNLSAFSELPKTRLGSQVSETPSSEQDQRSSVSSESNHQHCRKNKDEPVEVDVLIQKAAESLIHISLESAACFRDCSSKVGSHEMEIEEEQPQYSSDSFESITLKLTESSVDDYAVSLKLFEINETENKDFGFKLRRGRRLKDFQRDILPGLASLSRHEICEDINILEGVMRSREYRRIQSKMGNGESWCMPARSRRSRVNYVRRRNYARKRIIK